MNEEQREELFNLFKLTLASQIDEEKYKGVQSYEQLNALLAENPQDKDLVEESLSKYTEEELLEIAMSAQEEPSVEIAKKGKKLDYAKKLQKYKKGKKCACGCDLVLVKESGGKLTQKCACGCKAK